MIFHQCFDLKTDQLIETHLKDRGRLPLGKAQLHGFFFRFL